VTRTTATRMTNMEQPTTFAIRRNQQQSQHNNQPSRYENTGAYRLLQYATGCWVRTRCHLLGKDTMTVVDADLGRKESPRSASTTVIVSSLVGDTRTRTGVPRLRLGTCTPSTKPWDSPRLPSDKPRYPRFIPPYASESPSASYWRPNPQQVAYSTNNPGC
jgi:hypothetical protein